MQTHLEQDLQHIKEKVFKMMDMSLEAVVNSVDALKNMDIDAAESVIKNDNKIDMMENEIDDECIKILVTRQPAATDMRLLLAILKINTDIERIADLAVTISKQTKKIEGQTLIKPLVDIPRMADICAQMFKDSLQAITNKDSELAQDIIKRDDILDEINTQIYRELFTFMAEKPSIISQALSLLRISKSLERIGDHISNIAERAIYYIEGENVRHTDI